MFDKTNSLGALTLDLGCRDQLFSLFSVIIWTDRSVSRGNDQRMSRQIVVTSSSREQAACETETNAPLIKLRSLVSAVSEASASKTQNFPSLLVRLISTNFPGICNKQHFGVFFYFLYELFCN